MRLMVGAGILPQKWTFGVCNVYCCRLYWTCTIIGTGERTQNTWYFSQRIIYSIWMEKRFASDFFILETIWSCTPPVFVILWPPSSTPADKKCNQIKMQYWFNRRIITITPKINYYWSGVLSGLQPRRNAVDLRKRAVSLFNTQQAAKSSQQPFVQMHVHINRNRLCPISHCRNANFGPFLLLFLPSF